MKIGRDLSFADLRRQPAVLLGGFSSPWSVELTHNLRFRLQHGAETGQRNGIFDTKQSARFWAHFPIEYSSSEILEDYALVSRVLDSGSGQSVLMASGLSPYGTQAAAEFLSDETQLAPFAKVLGPGWESRNFQAVLHCTVRGYTPGRPKVIAWHSW